MSEVSFDARLAAEWRATAGEAVVPDVSAMIEQSGTEHASRTAVIAELDDARLMFEELRTWLDDAGAAQLATRRWTVRDVVAHLGSWIRQTRFEIEGLLAGQRFDEIIPFGVNGPHAWNQREVDERREWSLDELFDEIDAEHEKLIDVVVDMPEDDVHRVAELPRTIGEPGAPWHMALSSAICMTCWHSRLHLRRIDELLRGRS